MDKFLKNLASESPSPGGGAAAAVTGALGTALVAMVARINSGREEKKGQKISAETKARIKELDKIRASFLSKMAEDTKAFLALSKFSKEQRESAAYEKAVQKASGVPLEMCELSLKALKLAKNELGRTSRWLLSDLSEAGILLRAAFDSARLNVEVNLRISKNDNFVRERRAHLEKLGQDVHESANELVKAFG